MTKLDSFELWTNFLLIKQPSIKNSIENLQITKHFFNLKTQMLKINYQIRIFCSEKKKSFTINLTISSFLKGGLITEGISNLVAILYKGQ